MRNISLILISAALSIAIFGCAKSPKGQSEDARVLARINNYELTLADFKSEIDPVLARRYKATEPDLAKKALLEAIIIKKILIQEAQKENFDKDRAFMKEIERYWEQALLKLLIKKKIDELTAQGVPKDNEKKIQTALDEWIAGLKKNAKITIDEEALREIKIYGGRDGKRISK